MSSSGSSASSTSINSRLTAVASHLTSSRPKVVVCRDLGPDVMKILYERKDLEVSLKPSYTAHDVVYPAHASYEIVVWPEDQICDRKWLLENIHGASGVLVFLTDKVRPYALSHWRCVDAARAHRSTMSSWTEVRRTSSVAARSDPDSAV